LVLLCCDGDTVGRRVHSACSITSGLMPGSGILGFHSLLPSTSNLP
jgi:hypothetical protein